MAAPTTARPLMALMAEQGESSLLNSTLAAPQATELEADPLATFHLAVTACCLILGALGLLGNALALLVWSDARMQRPSPSLSVLLIGLAAFDLLFLLCQALSTHVYAALYFSDHRSSPAGESALWIVQAVTYPPMHVFRLASILVTVAVTLERALAVIRPLKAVSFSTRVNAYRCLVGVAVTSVLYNIPRSMERQLELATDPDTNQTYWDLKATHFVQTEFFRVYNLYIQFVVIFVIPFAVIFACNTAILYTLHHKSDILKSRDGVVPLRSSRGQGNACVTGAPGSKAGSEGKNVGACTKVRGRDNSGGNGRLTATIMALTLCFFLTHMVPAVSLIMKYMEISGLAKLGEGALEIQYLQGLGHVLVTFNSASNFLFFSLLGRKFRTVLLSRSCCALSCWKLVKRSLNAGNGSTLARKSAQSFSAKPLSECTATNVTRVESSSSSSSKNSLLQSAV